MYEWIHKTQLFCYWLLQVWLFKYFQQQFKVIAQYMRKKKISTEFKGSIVKRVMADTGPWIMKLE